MNQVVDAIRNRPLLAVGVSNAATALIALWLHARGQGGLRRWLARNAFRAVVGVVRVVASDLVTKEEKKIKDKTIAKVMGHVDGPRIQSIPQTGMPKAELVALMQASSLKETKWREGKISGTVYHSGAELADVICEAFRAFASSNPIHPDVFPTCRKMEAGLPRVSMVCLVYKFLGSRVAAFLATDPTHPAPLVRHASSPCFPLRTREQRRRPIACRATLSAAFRSSCCPDTASHRRHAAVPPSTKLPVTPVTPPSCRHHAAITPPSRHRHEAAAPPPRRPPAEVVAMCCELFGGGAEAAGAMTSGGTESIVMAVKAHRDYGRRRPHFLYFIFLYR